MTVTITLVENRPDEHRLIFDETRCDVCQQHIGSCTSVNLAGDHRIVWHLPWLVSDGQHERWLCENCVALPSQGERFVLRDGTGCKIHHVVEDPHDLAQTVITWGSGVSSEYGTFLLFMLGGWEEVMSR